MGATRVGPQATREYLARMRERYERAGREAKGGLLDEVCEVTGYHRKAVIRLLRRPAAPGRAGGAGRRVQYRPPVVAALRAIWTAAGYPWSVRLKALLPAWVPWARRRLRLTAGDRASAAADQCAPDRPALAAVQTGGADALYGRTKPGTLLKHHIPVQTERWNVTTPGFTEMDLVSHTGDRADGEFLHSLNVTDIQTTWVETRAVLGKSQEQVRQALETIRAAPAVSLARHRFGQRVGVHQRPPVSLLPGAAGFSSRAAARTRRTTTRTSSRKTGRMSASWWATTGTIRRPPSTRSTRCMPTCGSAESVAALGQAREEDARRQSPAPPYDAPQTPLDRVHACPEADRAKVAALARLQRTLDPFVLAARIEQQLERLYALANHRRGGRPVDAARPVENAKSAFPTRSLENPKSGFSTAPTGPHHPSLKKNNDEEDVGNPINGVMNQRSVTLSNGLTGPAPQIIATPGELAIQHAFRF